MEFIRPFPQGMTLQGSNRDLRTGVGEEMILEGNAFLEAVLPWGNGAKTDGGNLVRSNGNSTPS